MLRFYDPEFGQVLVDGVDVRKYNILDLREVIGFVSQEPDMFDYSVKDNVLYGCPKASNEDIVHAVQLANANEFIENNCLNQTIIDEPGNLLHHMQSEACKGSIITSIGKESYDESILLLRRQLERQPGEVGVSDLIDRRS